MASFLTGTYDALVLCVGLICNVMLENPPRGPFIPYKPHSLPNQAYQPRTSVSLYLCVCVCDCGKIIADLKLMIVYSLSLSLSLLTGKCHRSLHSK